MIIWSELSTLKDLCGINHAEVLAVPRTCQACFHPRAFACDVSLPEILFLSYPHGLFLHFLEVFMQRSILAFNLEPVTVIAPLGSEDGIVNSHQGWLPTNHKVKTTTPLCCLLPLILAVSPTCPWTMRYGRSDTAGLPEPGPIHLALSTWASLRAPCGGSQLPFTESKNHETAMIWGCLRQLWKSCKERDNQSAPSCFSHPKWGEDMRKAPIWKPSPVDPSENSTPHQGLVKATWYATVWVQENCKTGSENKKLFLIN